MSEKMTVSCGNVFEDLGFPPDEAAAMLARETLLMTVTAADATTSPWDSSEILDSPEMIEEYLRAAFETDDPGLITLAIGNVAKAIGMSEIARKSGLNRQSLYKTFAPGAKPRFGTILKVIRALGLRLAIEARPATV